ncbi:Spo0E family sporulation regulatory protein-aspartic acid phosphatase [Peribacillus aracenensis]|uniref:Spo0E family sporulation regulatory protein-aspartic acid phosphatase n=1 Tax=Peribacillus aracenensis TaxID=2976708 RepID=UPI0021A677E4|nr:Spo0E family sporulation regulatory protein-aspartic acid phosphatase [Peribacillus sp. BBB004]
MFLKTALDLKKSIEGYQKKMSLLVMNKGIKDPETIKTVQELDQQIVSYKRLLAEISSL